MSFNYETNLWGQGTADSKLTDPASFRLRQCFRAFANLPANSKILEVGCGGGQFIRALKKKSPAFSCFGCDISEKAITAAKQANDNVAYEICAEKLPYADNSFDGLMALDVLEHVASPTALVEEIHRVLKPGGIFYLFVPCEGDGLSLWFWLEEFGLKNDLTKKFAGHVNYFSRAEVEKLFPKDKFSFVRKRYGEHIVGQLSGVAAFWMMSRAEKRGLGALNNEAYFNRLEEKGGRPVRVLKKIFNLAINLESTLFARLPSPNMHLVLKKI